MLIGFFDDEVVSEKGTVLATYVNEIVDTVIKQQEAIGRHRDTIDWKLLEIYRVEEEVEIDDIRNYLPPTESRVRSGLGEPFVIVEEYTFNAYLLKPHYY